MPGTVDQIAAFFRGYNPSGGGAEEWNMWCQAFVSRISKQFGSFSRDYPTARAARLASGPLTTDFSQIQIGWVGYWLWNPDDHVAGVYAGGGFWVMGSRHITTAFGGVSRNAGLVSHADFQARAGLQFLGAAPANGGNILGIIAPPLAANQRRVIDDGYPANGRPGPGRNYPIVQTIPSGDDATFDAWTNGESINGNTIWLRGAFAKNWFSATVFENQTASGLPFFQWDAPVDPGTPAQPENPDNPGTLPYNFDQDFPDITQRTVPANRTNWEPGNFPARPTNVVIHQWDDPARNPTLAGVLKTFTDAHADTSADPARAPHFTIDADGNIIQNVSLQDRAYHAGPRGNDYVGIEVEPHFGEKTIAALVVLLRRLRERNDGTPLVETLHSQVAATSCGTFVAPHLDVIKAAVRYDAPVDPEPPVDPVDPVDPTDPVDPEPPVTPPTKPGWVAGLVGIVVALVLAVVGAISGLFG